MALLTNINGKFSVSDAGAVTFNNAFTFPTTDGAANYVLQTNGSGQLAWALNGNGDISGSGDANTVTKFTGSGSGVKTIGNGPITFSGNNSTFLGTIGSGTITSTGIIKAATTFQSTGGSMLFFVPNVGQALKIAQNTGNVFIGTDTVSQGAHKLVIKNASTVGTVNSHLALIGDSATIGQGAQILFSESGDSQAFAGGTISFERTGSNSMGNLLFGTRASGGDATTTTTTALKLDSSQNATFAGDVDVNGTQITVGTNASIFAENNLRFKSAGAAFIDHNTVSQSIKFRLSNSSSLDVTPLEVTPSYLSSTVDMYFGDNDKIRLGASSDLQIYHDGTDSIIADSGTGNLYIRAADQLRLQGINESNMLIANQGGSVNLYHNNSQKLETTSTGITVTGAASATTFSGDLNGTINTVTTATTKGNATNDTTVATTAFVQNVVGTIPAGLVFQGTWNASTNTPTLTSGSGTTGHFYIVSVAGSTNLDGITDWQVGDWAVFIEQGASDQWEKIDNSSVLGGSGTGGTIAGWSGSGTSVTLGNSPVTFSGNNISIPGTVVINNTLFVAEYIQHIGNTSNNIRFTTDAIGISANATFGGDVSLGDSKQLKLGNSADLLIFHDGANSYVKDNGIGNLLIISNGASVQINKGTTENMAEFIVDGAVKLYYDSAKKFETTSTGVSVTGGGTFTDSLSIIGDVKKLQWIDTEGNWKIESGNGSNKLVIHSESLVEDYLTIKGTGVIQFNDYGAGTLVTDASGNISVSSGGGSGGPFLPLSAGSTKKLTDTLYIQGTNSTGAESVLLRGVSSDNADFLGSIRTANVGGYDQEMRFYTSDANGTTNENLVLTLDEDKNATFTGHVFVEDGNKFFGANAIAASSEDGNYVASFGKSTSGSAKFAGNITVGAGTSTFTGNVTAPELRLQSSGTTYLNIGNATTGSASSDGASIGYFTGQSSLQIVNRENDAMVFSTNATERMRIDSTGIVHFSKTNNTSHIVATINHASNNFLYVSGGTAGASFGDDGQNTRMLAFDNDYLRFDTAGSEKMRIDNNGNVSVGTDTPLYLYSEQDIAQIAVNRVSSTGVIPDTSRSAAYINLNAANGGSFLSFHTANANNINATERMRINSNGTTKFNANILVDVINNAANSANIIYRSGTSTLVGGGSTANKLYVLDNGKVGIGTTSPGTKLVVSGGDDVASTGVLELKTSGSTNLKFGGASAYSWIQSHASKPLYINQLGNNIILNLGGGNVGIGTDSPNTKLDVNGVVVIAPNTDGKQTFEFTTNASNDARLLMKSVDTVKVDIQANDKSYFNGGNVGIGTTSPSAAKLVVDSSTAPQILVKNSGGGNAQILFEDNSGLTQNASITFDQGGQNTLTIATGYNSPTDLNRINIAPAGNIGLTVRGGTGGSGLGQPLVGIGTTSPSAKLHVLSTANADVVFKLENTNTGTSAGARIELIDDEGGSGSGAGALRHSIKSMSQTVGNWIIESGSSAGQLDFSTLDSFAMRIDENQNVLIGKTTTSFSTVGLNLFPNGEITAVRSSGKTLALNRRGSDGEIVSFSKSDTQVGNISVTGAATAYNTSSDYRLKENVVSMTGALDRVSQLKPSRFNFIADADKTVDGFLAHEVQDIVPEAITGTKDAVDNEGNPEYQGIDQSKLVPLLVGAIQEQQKIIDDLKSRIKQLEN